MKKATKELLELFIEKADELANEDFTQFIEDFGHQFGYCYTSDSQQITVSTVAPTQTMHKSFLLTYRMFIQVSERMRILNPTKSVSAELLDSSLSSQWLGLVQDVARRMHTFLLEKPNGSIQFQLIDQNGMVTVEVPTRWDILETLLYGYFSHATQRQRLKNWLSTPFAPLVEQFLLAEFRNTLIETLSAILHLAQYARIELGLPEKS